MPSSNLVRTGGGLASATAGILLLFGHLLDLGGDSDYGTVLGGALVLLAHVVLVFALMGLYAAQAEHGGPLGGLGMVLSVAGMTIVSGVVLVEIAGASGAEVEDVLGAGLPGALVLLGGLAVLIGLVLFGVATMRAGVFPRWAGLLLIVGDLVFGVGSFAGAAATIFGILGAMVAFVRQRRMSRWNRVIDLLVLSGLIIPPAVVPTIWVLQELGIFRTLGGLILIEIAFGLSFTILLFQAFIATIPRELDEAAILDGAGPMRLFFRVIFPLLKSVIVTVIVVQSVFVFNDFVHPLYFLPGDENATVQLTLFNFQSQFTTQYNLLFTDILLITIPMLLMFLFFNKRIVEGMTAGAVKG